MRVLITGITGFVGGFLAEECARQGWDVQGTTHLHDKSQEGEDAPLPRDEEAPPLPDVSAEARSARTHGHPRRVVV